MRFPGWPTSILILGLLTRAASAAVSVESLADAARQYRAQVYESYRLNRPALDQHLQTAQALMDAWRERGAPDSEVAQLTDWFRRATLAIQSTQSAGGTNSGVSTTTDSARTQSTGLTSRPSSRLRRGAVERAGAERRTGIEQSGEPAIGGGPANHRARSERRSPPPRSAPPDDLAPLIPADLIPDRPIEDPTVVDERLPRIRLHSVPPYDPSAPSRTPTAAPPTPLAPYLAPVRSSTARRKTEINVEALTAKIRSINLSLTALEADLQAQAEWSVEKLEAVGQDLSRLMDVANLSQLYYEALPAGRRRAVEPLIDRGPLQALFAQRVLETRLRLANQSRRTPSAEVDERLNRLQALSRTIQRWNGDHSQ